MKVNKKYLSIQKRMIVRLETFVNILITFLRFDWYVVSENEQALAIHVRSYHLRSV